MDDRRRTADAASDEEDAREHLGWAAGDFLVRRTVTAGRWETVSTDA